MGDVIEGLHFPNATALERFGRIVENDSILLKISSTSLTNAYRSSTTIAIPRKQFIDELLPQLENYVKGQEESMNITKKRIVLPDGNFIECERIAEDTYEVRQFCAASQDWINLGNMKMDKVNALLERRKSNVRITQETL